MLYPNKYQSIIIELEENREALINAARLMLKPFIKASESIMKFAKALSLIVQKRHQNER